MPVHIRRRKDRPGLWLDVRWKGERVRKRADSDQHRAARREGKRIEEELRASHAERAGTGRRQGKTFAEAVVSYVTIQKPSGSTKDRLNRLLEALGPKFPLAKMKQETVDRLQREVLRPNASPATVKRGIITPIRAVMNHAAKREWCNPVAFEIPKNKAAPRTLFLFPNDAERLVDCCASHLAPLIEFLICTGARVSEALELEWDAVDLPGAHAIFWRTKPGTRRDAALSRRAVQALQELPHRTGVVFRGPDGQPYADLLREAGGQFKTAWAGAKRRAGINPRIRVHDLRHTWATWHYSLHKDLLKLRIVGGWSSVALVERYAHLMPVGHDIAITAFLNGHQTVSADDLARLHS